jgi:peptide/nickel transport system ATP-binding protein
VSGAPLLPDSRLIGPSVSGSPLLQVENLRIDLTIGASRFAAVEGVSFSIGRGETYGLVGESGCGKSITALGLIGLLRPPLSLGGGTIRFDGRDIQDLPPAAMRSFRGRRIAMIFQEPMTALNPVSPVGRQIAEMFVLHEGASWREAERRAVEALASVRVPAPERRVKDYPHQLSGGMRQRVMIAIALACNPDLLLADEPTTALDVTVQAEILDLIRDLCAAKGTAVLMISHDLGLIANMCRRVGVMYAGRIVEERAAEEVFRTPSHPYTNGLVASLPLLGARSRNGQRRLQEISGVVPPVTAFPEGCRFNPRCQRATDICRMNDPAITPLRNGTVRCHHHG